MLALVALLAADVGVLIEPDDPKDAVLAVAIADATRARLGDGLGMLAILDPDLIARSASTARALREKTALGLDALEGLDLPAARDALEAAVLGIAADAPGLETELRDALLGLAVVALYEGDALRADGLFVALASLPGKSPPVGAERYPSKILARFDAVRAELESRPTGRISVSTEPAGAVIIVDGIDRGQTPAEISGLAEGLHVVALVHPWGLPSASFVDVVADDVVPVSRPLETSPAKRGPRDLAAFEERFRGSLKRGLIDGVWTDATGEHAVTGVPTDGGAEAAAQRLADAIARAVNTQPVVAIALPIEDDVAITDRWWFWAGVGAVVGVAAGAAIAAAAQEGEGLPRGTAIFGF